MKYHVVAGITYFLITILSRPDGNGITATMLCRSPNTFGDELFSDSIYPDTFNGATKEEAIDFFRGRILPGASISYEAWA